MSSDNAAAADAIAVAHAERFHRLAVIEVFALWIPIFLWLAHLGSMAALVGYVRNNPSKWWVFWIDTGTCATGIILCILIGLFIGLRPDASETVGTPEGRTRFLGLQVLLAGLASLALTLAEGSYVLFISVHHK